MKYIFEKTLERLDKKTVIELRGSRFLNGSMDTNDLLKIDDYIDMFKKLVFDYPDYSDLALKMDQIEICHHYFQILALIGHLHLLK